MEITPQSTLRPAHHREETISGVTFMTTPCSPRFPTRPAPTTSRMRTPWTRPRMPQYQATGAQLHKELILASKSTMKKNTEKLCIDVKLY